MRRFAASSRAVLAVSLHATTDEVRDYLCPVNRRWPLAELITTLEHLFPRSSRSHHVLIEVLLGSGLGVSACAALSWWHVLGLLR